MRLIQFLSLDGKPQLGRIDDDGVHVAVLQGIHTCYDLVQTSFARGTRLQETVKTSAISHQELYAPLLSSGRLLPPLTHPDPHHCLVSGTGLTHLGSAATRNAMHQKAADKAENAPPPTDSARMFQWGVEGGKPSGVEPGAQPEWFYKGNGNIVVGCGNPITAPSFALDCGEEPELVGLYVISPQGTPVRLGFAIGNEFSDHVTERKNYLYLAHSKLRQCSVGPELRTDPLPSHLEGRSCIRRGEKLLWEKPFLTGEDNMCHSIANLEYHHFKYAAHRVPGDVHLHFFGTATLSFADGIRVEAGDCYEIHLPALGATLVNPLAIATKDFELGGVATSW